MLAVHRFEQQFPTERIASEDVTMGSHGVASARLRAGKNSQHAGEPAASQRRSPRGRTLRDWPVSWRLVAVIVLALIMGLVFGGLRVASAADSAAQFGRVSQLASLGQQVTGLVQALQDERDETTGVSSGGNPDTLKIWYHTTDTAAARVRAVAVVVRFGRALRSRYART